MPEAGWYPDPGGRPGHYRYWDGQTWAPTTSTNPFPRAVGPATGPAPGTDPGGPPRRRGRWGLVVLAALVALVVVVAGVLVARGGNRTVVDGDPVPTATTSGGDDGPPSETPSSLPTPTPSPTPSASTSPIPTQPSGQPCPVGDPTAVQPHPRDGRIHGGGLSIPSQAGWASPGVELSGFSWAYDVGETDTAVQPSWYAAYAVGALSLADGFEDPRSAAELSMECTMSSFFYRGITGRTDLVSEATTVDGYRAWTIRSELRTHDDRTTFAGDTVQVTVVDLEADDALAFFWGSAPIGDQPLTDRLDQVADHLQVG